MQSPSVVPSASLNNNCFNTPSTGRQVTMNPQYVSPSYAQGESYAPIPSVSAHRPYHAGQFQSYGNTSPSSAYNTHSSPDRHAGWQSSSPDDLARSQGYACGDPSSYSPSDAQRQQGHARSGYYAQGDHTSYGSRRAHSSVASSGLPANSPRYPVSPIPPVPYASYSSFTAPHNNHVASAHAAQPTAAASARCEWGDRRCAVPVEDTSPSGIARHLRQYHDVAATDNRNRGVCIWGGRCGKDMFPSSFGKHIAECHLRNMTKQCPHCGADFARADTLSRHIKAFCPNTVNHAGHTYSST